MGLLRIDRDKCAGDGICARICPLGLIVFDPRRGPECAPEAERLCVGCGQCVAACPHGALDNAKNPLARSLPIPPGFRIDPETAAVFLRSRRSIRCYKKEPLPRELVLHLLEIARFAPSGHNSQGISYLIVEGGRNLARIREIVVEWMREVVRTQPELGARFHMPALIRAHEKGRDRILRGAPHLLVAHCLKSALPPYISTYLALEYVELYAPVLGVGTCWAGYAQVCAQQFPALAGFLKIPADRVITGILMAGYPKFAYYRLPDRNPLDASWFGDPGSGEGGPDAGGV